MPETGRPCRLILQKIHNKRRWRRIGEPAPKRLLYVKLHNSQPEGNRKTRRTPRPERCRRRGYGDALLY